MSAHTWFQKEWWVFTRRTKPLTHHLFGSFLNRYTKYTLSSFVIRYKIERMNKQTSKQAKYGVTRVEYQKKWNIRV